MAGKAGSYFVNLLIYMNLRLGCDLWICHFIGRSKTPRDSLQA